MTQAVEHEAHLDLCRPDLLGLRIALVQFEIGADLLLPFGGEPLLVFADPDIRRRSRVGLAGILRRVAGRLLPAPTNSCEAAVCTVSTFGSSSVGFFCSFCVTTRSGSSVSVGVSFGRSVGLTSAFCSASAGEATEASASGPGGSSVSSAAGDVSSTPISVDIGAKPVGTVVGAQMRQRQRRAANVQGDAQPLPRSSRAARTAVALASSSLIASGLCRAGRRRWRADPATPSSATSFIR